MDETPAKRQRILLITRNLPPLRGGMERLNRQMVIALNEVAEVVVIGPTGCRAHLPAYVATHEIPVAPLWRFLLLSALQAWRLGEQAFDLVLAGSGLTAPAALLAARRARARSAAYVHGLDLVAKHAIYRALWLPALRRLDSVLANSANTAALALRAGVAGGNVSVLHPGTVIPDRMPDVGDFRDRFDLGTGPLLLSVGRLTERKGLRQFISQALPAITARFPDVRLLVIGDDAPDALRKDDAHRAADVEATARAAGLAGHVIRLGACDDATLARAYAAADVHVFPVRHVPGDVEGFGMVAIEAAAHGLPTVAFAVGGVPDAVREGVSGFLLPPGDYAGFVRRVCDVIDAGREAAMRRTARAFSLDFSWDRFGERLRGGWGQPDRNSIRAGQPDG